MLPRMRHPTVAVLLGSLVVLAGCVISSEPVYLAAAGGDAVCTPACHDAATAACACDIDFTCSDACVQCDWDCGGGPETMRSGEGEGEGEGGAAAPPVDDGAVCDTDVSTDNRGPTGAEPVSAGSTVSRTVCPGCASSNEKARRFAFPSNASLHSSLLPYRS